MISEIDIILWIGVFTLLIGYISEYKKHFIRILGFSFLGVFWLGQAPYYISISDYVNSSLCIITLPLFLYFAYHEYLSKKWSEDPEVMRFLAGGVSLSMLIYFSVQRIPILAGNLIKIVADHTVFITNLLGYDFMVGSIQYVGNPIFYRLNDQNIYVNIIGSNINIILACTGLQAIAAGVALIYCTQADKKRKIEAILLIAPILYIANVLRNVLVIYLTVEGITSFNVAHNEIAKTGSVVVLILLLLAVFEVMPEFYENIINVLKLPKRKTTHLKQQE